MCDSRNTVLRAPGRSAALQGGRSPPRGVHTAAPAAGLPGRLPGTRGGDRPLWRAPHGGFSRRFHPNLVALTPFSPQGAERGWQSLLRGSKHCVNVHLRGVQRREKGNPRLTKGSSIGELFTDSLSLYKKYGQELPK